MDTISVEARSSVMSRVRSIGNRTTEWRLRGQLIRAGIRGWKIHSTEVPGNPDFLFSIERIVVFTDGCFWHGCRRCKRTPSSNIPYWRQKIERNRKRDRAINVQLRKQGWTVLRIWEHELNSADVVSRVRLAIAAAHGV